MAVDLKTIWRDEFVPAAEATRVPVPVAPRPPTIGAAPPVIERPAMIGVAPDPWYRQRIENPESEYWDMSEEEQDKFNVAMKYGGFTLAQSVFPNVRQPPYRPRGAIVGATTAFMKGAGVPSMALPEVEDVSPFVEIPAHLAGEVVKYAGIGKIMRPLAELAPAATGLAAGGIRQIGREEPSLEDPLIEMLLVGGGVELVKGVAQQIKAGAKTIDLVKPVSKYEAIPREVEAARQELLGQLKTTEKLGVKYFTEKQIRGMTDAELELYTGRKIRQLPPKPAVEPIPVGAKPEEIGKSLGVKYDGIQEAPKRLPDGTVQISKQHIFTDPVTKSSFNVKDLKDVQRELQGLRSQFAKAEAPLTDLTPGESSVTLGCFGYTPELMESVQKTWIGVVDKTAKKAVELMPPKIADITKTVTRGHLPAQVKQVIKDREKGIILGRRDAKELGESISKNIPEKYQFEVYKTLDPTHIGDLGEFPKHLQGWVQAARNKIDELGLEAVSLGLLKPEIYQRNLGEYLGRYYKPHQEFKKFWSKAFGNWFRRGIKGERFRPRILKTEAARREAGLITDPAYAVTKTIGDLTYDIETAKAFRRLAQNPEWVSATEPTIGKAGFKWVPGHTDALKLKYGDLAGKWIRKDIFDEVNVITETRGEWQRVYDRLLGMWKFGKTALNPATHGRNVFSNVILADFGGLSPLRVDIYAKSAREYIKKGRFYKEALEDGLLGSDWFGAEVKSLTSGMLKPGQKRSMFDIAWDMAGRTPVAKIVKKAGDVYQGEEHFFKLALYIQRRGLGASRAEATAHAHKYLFDYNDLAPALRKLRRAPWGGPFLSFTAKALPVVAETAVKHPFKVGKYFLMFNAMNEYGKSMIGMDDREYAKMKASLPPWRRSGWQVLLPFRDKEGKPVLWDLTYNLPWGDIAEQGTFIPVPVLGAVVERFFGGNPFARVPIEILANKDFFRDRQLFERDLDVGMPGKFAGIPIPTAVGGLATEAIVRHAARQFAPGIAIAAPPVAETLMGKPRPTGEARDPLVEILNRLMGIKFVSIDVERGRKIKLGKLVKLRNELISRVYKLKADVSLSPEEFERELDLLREANEGLIEKAQKLNVPFEPEKVPADTTKARVDLRTIWR